MLFIRGGIFYFLLFIFMIAEIQHKVKKKLGVVQLFYERERERQRILWVSMTWYLIN